MRHCLPAALNTSTITRALALVPLLAAAIGAHAADDLQQGLIAEYFELSDTPGDFVDVKGKKPFLVRIDKQINYDLSLIHI